MKRLLSWIAVCLGLGAILLVAGYTVALMDSNERPEGDFAGYALIPHDPADLFTFRDGQVIWKSCCGTELYGTYVRETSGQWIWSMTKLIRRGKDPALWQSTPIYRLILRPGRFGLEVEPEDRSFPVVTIRRRLFEKYAL